MSVLGFDAIGNWALGHPPAQGTTFSLAVFSAVGAGALLTIGAPRVAGVLAVAGAGNTSFKITAINSAVLAAAGHGAASLVGTGVFNSTASMVGTGGMLVVGTGVFNSRATMAGNGALSGVLYGFFIDAEVACVHEETRHFSAIYENRVAIIDAEDRVYEVDVDDRRGPTLNRKRVC